MKKQITIAFIDGSNMSFCARENECQKDSFGMLFHIHKATDPSTVKDVLIPWTSIMSIVVDEVPEDVN